MFLFLQPCRQSETDAVEYVRAYTNGINLEREEFLTRFSKVKCRDRDGRIYILIAYDDLEVIPPFLLVIFYTPPFSHLSQFYQLSKIFLTYYLTYALSFICTLVLILHLQLKELEEGAKSLSVVETRKEIQMLREQLFKCRRSETQKERENKYLQNQLLLAAEAIGVMRDTVPG